MIIHLRFLNTFVPSISVMYSNPCSISWVACSSFLAVLLRCFIHIFLIHIDSRNSWYLQNYSFSIAVVSCGFVYLGNIPKEKITFHFCLFTNCNFTGLVVSHVTYRLTSL